MIMCPKAKAREAVRAKLHSKNSSKELYRMFVNAFEEKLGAYGNTFTNSFH